MIGAISPASPIIPAMTAAAIKTRIMKSPNWAMNMTKGDLARFSLSWFRPYCSSRLRASSRLMPLLEEPNLANASSIESKCQSI